MKRVKNKRWQEGSLYSIWNNLIMRLNEHRMAWINRSLTTVIYKLNLVTLLTISIRQAAVAAYRYDAWIWQAARAAIVTSSFKILLTQTFPLCGATCYMLSSRTMNQLFNGVNFVFRSVEVYQLFRCYLQVLVARIRNFDNGRPYYLHWRFATLCVRPFIWQFDG